jgi:MYXO-CTERM domain-containing protein
MVQLRSVFFSGAILFAPSVAFAQGEACLRDTACGGAELCIDAECSAPDPSVDACSSDDDCDDGDCVDGYCKVEGVVCRNPAGACWAESNSSHCACADGQSSSSVGGFDPDNPPPELTDEELVAECTAQLEDECGTEAPALPDSCVGEVLDHCEAFVDQENALLAACGEDVPEVNIGRVGECCDDYENEEYAAYRECLLAIEDISCDEEALETCEGGGAPEDASGDKEGGDDDDEKAGCRISGPGASPFAALALLVAIALRRRRA